LIRSITSWTIGRYASWICIPNPENLAIHYQQYLVPILQGILMLCADNNKEVQKSGCSALATIEEEARENLVPYLEPIIDTLTKCFHIYQKKNLLILYDTFGTLAEAVGSNLSQKQYIDKFMPPLLQKYQECEDDDYDLFSILESLASIATALGVSFAPYCLPIWQRCVRLIKQTLSDADAYNRDPNNHVQPDKDFIVISLDLLGAIVQALGAESEGLLLDPTEPTLFVLLKMTMNDETADARSCSFALLGDIAINSFKSLIPHLNDFVGLAAQNIRTGCDSTQTASMNNACWALGEISLRNQNQMSQYTPVLLQRLVPLLLSRDTPRSLSENSSITIGRLALNNPELIAPHLQTFLTRFMESLVAVNDNMEKREALFGILKAIKLNPAPLLESFEGFVNVGTSKSESAELKREFFELLSAIKAQMKVEDWDLLKVRLPEFLKERLRIFYGL
jgi:transportin-1